MDVFDLNTQKLLQKTKNICEKYFSNCFMNEIIVVAVLKLYNSIQNHRAANINRKEFSCSVEPL